MHKVEIKVTGQIDEQWSQWLGGLNIHHSEPNQTILSGYLTDQAALYGIITRLRDLGLQLNSIHNEDVDITNSSKISKGAENE
ncbi:MAG: hypothetical protein PVG14_19470 [Anaerolineales bacterium]|jgi:hypothetical protein